MIQMAVIKNYILYSNLLKRFCRTKALRPTKNKSGRSESNYYLDSKFVRVVGGKGGDGCISFLQLWCNERAGPDGGDGGHGGHIIFKSSSEVRSFNHVSSILKANDGVKGGSKECHGKNAQNTIVNVPIGTIIRNIGGRIVCDLYKENCMYVAARGGSGGKGNCFFTTSKQNSPKVCEYGPPGEDILYKIELQSMADIGLIGCPNTGKSTLLKAITRAKPKVAPYAFTTLRPHIGIIHYNDYEQLAVADLPGLIPGSHKNKGLGTEFLKHAERCSMLVFVIDASIDAPWDQYNLLVNELRHFNKNMVNRPSIIVANKIDVKGSNRNVDELKQQILPLIVPVSAKKGTNISLLLKILRESYTKNKINC